MFTGKAIKVQPPLFGGTYILESWGSLKEQISSI